VSIATGEYVGWVRITTGKAALYVPQSTSATGVAKGVQVGSTFGIASGSTIHFSITYEV
jgi:hypothetical protein